MSTPDNDLKQGQTEHEMPQKPVDVGVTFRTWLEKQEKQAYIDWMAKLTPEELESYEMMGFQFQLLKAICQNPEMIALSADERADKKEGDEDEEKIDRKKNERSSERFSFNEVVQIVSDLEKIAEKFLDTEVQRKQNPLFDQFIIAYNTLRAFLAQQEKIGFIEVQENFSVTVMPYFDTDLLRIIETAMPPDMVTIIMGGEISSSTNGKVEKSDVKVAFTKMVRALQLNEEEKEQFKHAIRVILKVRQKIFDNRESTKKGLKSQLEISDLREVVEALGSMECLRRVYPSNPDTGIPGIEKMFGLNEVHRLVQFISSWKGTFRWLGKMKVGKIFQDEEESDDDREKRLDEEREKRQDTIKNFTNAFNMIFPDPLAPMIVKRHKEVLRRRIQSYKVLAEFVNGMKDEKLKKDLKRVLFKISTILSYLDYMWNMHEVEQNGAGKHIVYPKKMLLLGPLIIQEIEDLMATINLLSQQYEGALGNGDEQDTDKMFDIEEKPRGLGIAYEESNMFRLGPDTIISLTRDNALATADVQTEEEKRSFEFKKKLSQSLWQIAFMFQVTITSARRNLKATRVKNVLVNEEKSTDGEKSTPTLSYDIHDFINDLRDAFSTVLFELAKMFDENVSRNDVLPENAAHEEQAARLRYQLYALGTKIKPSAEVMAYAMMAAPEQISQEIVPGLQAIFTNLAADINEFQRYQERNLNDKKYHEVLRGAGYEKLVRLANAINDFTENHNDQLDAPAVELFLFRKRLDELAEKSRMAMSMGKLPQNGALGIWLKDLDAMVKVENLILANGLRPEEMQVLQTKYVEKFMHVLNVLHDICKKEGFLHSTPEGIETQARVASAVQEHFKVFYEANPLVEQCVTEKFTPCFHKFYKLMHLMSDFTQVSDLQTNPNTAEQEFLKNHDMQKAEVFARECKSLLEGDYRSTDRIQKNKLLLSLATCREALGHLMFRAPERVEILDIILNDMENTIRVLYEKGKPVKSDDLETFYLQFLREAAEDPILVQ